MTGKLITLPLRVAFQSARLVTRAAGGAAGRAASLAGHTIDALAPDLRGAAEPPPPEPTGTEPPPPEPARTEPPAPAPTAPVAEEPAHVSEEPELVSELAEPGAEDGAGADVTVREPWSGYRHMNAREVITRAEQSSPAELAAVRLYESRHLSRETVLAAVDRRLKLGNGGDPA